MLRGGVVVFVVLIGQTGSLFAQQKVASRQKPAPVSVPFVGCRSDGQAGPEEAPSGTSLDMPIRAEQAERLAYYNSGRLGVLAPRGWYCFGAYGSGGESVLVSPMAIDARMIFSGDWSGFAGSAVHLSHRIGDTSGRFDVADIIARVFPAFRAFTAQVSRSAPGYRPSFGPYPNDVLTYKGGTVVEYRTPAQTTGLGTRSWLKKNDSPITGVAILAEATPDLFLLAVRLPSDLGGLTPLIVQQLEREARDLPQPKSHR